MSWFSINHPLRSTISSIGATGLKGKGDAIYLFGWMGIWKTLLYESFTWLNARFSSFSRRLVNESQMIPNLPTVGQGVSCALNVLHGNLSCRLPELERKSNLFYGNCSTWNWLYHDHLTTILLYLSFQSYCPMLSWSPQLSLSLFPFLSTIRKKCMHVSNDECENEKNSSQKNKDLHGSACPMSTIAQ